ncbi:MAG TPA: S9 family peptidase [Pseudonocardiaceae bacterium]|nr:S9 family peptidase [Pseudonocardiaceae bacterium]
MRPDDLALIRVPGRPALHGDALLVAVSRPDPVRNRDTGAIWRIGLDGTEPVRWTWGEQDSGPVFSPDGAWLAFLRVVDGDGAKAVPQLYVMPATGGEPRVLTDLPLGVGEPVFAPDSRRIAFTARIPEPGRYGTPAEPGATAPTAAQEAPRRITRLDYRHDDIGFVGDRHRRLFVVDVDGGQLHELTDGRCEVHQPQWTPDGTHLVVYTPRELGVRETLHHDIYAVAADGGQPVRLCAGPGEIAALTVTGDGTILFLGTAFAHHTEEPLNTGLWALPLDLAAPGTPRRLTDAETVDAIVCQPLVHDGGVLVTVRSRGTTQLCAVPRDAEDAKLDELTVVAGANARVLDFTRHGNRIAAVVSTVDNPGELVVIDPAGSRVLTDFGAELRAVGLCRQEELTATAPDGYPVHGFLVLPEGPGPHPVLLNVHGGPFSLFQSSFFDEAQVYAAAGYAVVLPNPRGSAGYGRSHGRAVVNAIGTVDVDDVLALLDTATARPDCDGSRVGVMGGSYGGFMTSWLAAHHGERFTAAWSERAVNSWESLVGSSDIGWYFVDIYLGSDPEVQRDRSPLHHAEKITIPFAVVHSEQDWRCPLEQAERMFVALRRNGTPAEMLLFPSEGHELSRSGQPRHRVQRLQAVLDWWRRWLPVR